MRIFFLTALLVLSGGLARAERELPVPQPIGAWRLYNICMSGDDATCVLTLRGVFAEIARTERSRPVGQRRFCIPVDYNYPDSDLTWDFITSVQELYGRWGPDHQTAVQFMTPVWGRAFRAAHLC